MTSTPSSLHDALFRFTDDLVVSDDGWRLDESGWDPDRAVATGSNFMIGNGYLGYRATSPEQRADGFVALVVTDTYDCADGQRSELVTAPNPLFVSVTVDGAHLGIDTAEQVVSSLDLRGGVSEQDSTHRLASGRSVSIRVERTASLEALHVITQRVTISTNDGQSVEAQIDAGIDGQVWDLNGVHLPNVELAHSGPVLTASGVTGESGVGVAVSAKVSVSADETGTTSITDGRILTRYSVTAETIVIETVAAVCSSNDADDPMSRAVSLTSDGDHASIVDASARQWAAHWRDHDVVIDGSPLDDAALRFSNYHQRICTPAHTDHLPVGARGLSCQAYQGAAFWDQEIYNLPAYTFTEPDLARKLLVYRHLTLDGARRKAARLGYEGAYYAWMSGATGDELCPDVFFVDVLTGREIRNHFNIWQMHISPDVVTSIARYIEITDDTDFLVDHGAEIAFEVARFLRSFVRHDDSSDTYHCIRLLGPDEWHENVDDNAFTNYQAHAALGFAIDTFELMTIDHSDRLAELCDAIDLASSEVDRWRVIRDRIVLPSADPETGLIEQFDGFFELEDIRPTELATRLIDPTEYWGWPNGIAVRTQVSKQADVAMLLWLQPDRFDDATTARNYEYYEARCSHNSSLSHAAYGMVAARLGDGDRSLEHFRATSRVDLLNTNHAVVAGTFIGGIHTAACGGTNQLAVQGIGGLGFRGGHLTIAPTLPSSWTALTYPVSWRGQRLTVSVTADQVAVTADDTNECSVEVEIDGQMMQLDAGRTVQTSRSA